MSRDLPKRYKIPGNLFDEGKFRARYGVTDRDYAVGLIGATLYISLNVNLPDDPPIFDPPTPQKTGDERQGQAIPSPLLTLESHPLLTHPVPGTFEYLDDGANGHLYFTVNENGLPTRRLIV
jgi:hypothetical protein